MQPAAYSLLRLLQEGALYSAEQLAKRLSLSSADIADLISQLIEQGAAIQVREEGYQVIQKMDLLDAARLRNALPVPVEVLDECPSTNTLLLESEACGPRLVVCELQTAGRGRRGHAWYSGLADSLSFSLSWPFTEGVARLTGLPLVVGVACVRALEKMGVEGVRLKWPNDVIHAHGKLAGILVETKASQVIIGIGLNVRNAHRYAHKAGQVVTDLEEIALKSISRTELFQLLAQQLLLVLEEFGSRGFAAFRDEWSSLHAYAGQRVRLTNEQIQVEGIAQGVSEEGALLIATAQGERLFFSGELRKAA